MSLRIHLPLNGNLNNQGLSDLSSSNSNITYDNNGKIGKCLSSGTMLLKSETTKKILNNNEFSFCTWIYPNANTGTDTSNSYRNTMIFGQSSTGSNYRQYSVFLYPDVNSLHLGWQSAPNSGQILNYVKRDILPSYKWSHLCVTYKNPDVTVYLNGQVIDRLTATMNCSSFEYDTPLMGDSTLRRFNDYRIYDHCLSTKEVKELSKGLVLHYKLDNNGFGNENLLKNTFDFSGWLPAGVVSLLPDTYNGFSATYAVGAWRYYYQNIALQEGKTYTLSAKVKCQKDNWVAFFGYDGNGQGFHYFSTDDWETYSFTFVAPHSDVIRCRLENGGSQQGLYVACMKLEEGTKATPWCPAPPDPLYSTLGLNDNIEHDCSGYGYDGTKNGTISTRNNSPKYDVATVFNGSTYIMGNGSKTPRPSDALTLSAWIRKESNLTNGQNIISSYEGGGAGIHVINSEIYFQVLAGSYINVGTPVSDYTWTHVVGTYDKQNLKIYINGVLKNSKVCTDHISYNQTTPWAIGCNPTYSGGDGGEHFYGSVSDVHIYATALSDSDIKELYETSASIDKQGNIYCAEIKEV